MSPPCSPLAQWEVCWWWGQRTECCSDWMLLWPNGHTVAWFSPQSTFMWGEPGTNLSGPNSTCKISPIDQMSIQERLYKVVLGNSFHVPLHCSHDTVTFFSGTPHIHGGGLAYPEKNPTVFNLKGVSKQEVQALRDPLFFGKQRQIFQGTSPVRNCFWGMWSEWVNVCIFWNRSYVNDERGKRGEW